jgi:prophage regulatory protein
LPPSVIAVSQRRAKGWWSRANDDRNRHRRAQPPERLLRLAEVRHRVGLGKTMIYALIGEGRFPRPYKITPAAARWSEREVDSWIEAVVRNAGAN